MEIRAVAKIFSDDGAPSRQCFCLDLQSTFVEFALTQIFNRQLGRLTRHHSHHERLNGAFHEVTEYETEDRALWDMAACRDGGGSVSARDGASSAIDYCLVFDNSAGQV